MNYNTHFADHTPVSDYNPLSGMDPISIINSIKGPIYNNNNQDNLHVNQDQKQIQEQLKPENQVSQTEDKKNQEQKDEQKQIENQVVPTEDSTWQKVNDIGNFVTGAGTMIFNTKFNKCIIG